MGKVSKEYHRQYYLNNPEKYKGRHIESYRLEKKFGITLDDKERMMAAQEGRCKICGGIFKNTRKAHVDHNHTTGKIRAILCDNCNRGIGMFNESIGALKSAIEYLEFYKDLI